MLDAGTKLYKNEHERTVVQAWSGCAYPNTKPSCHCKLHESWL